MLQSFEHIPLQFETKPSTFGVLKDSNGRHYIVLTDREGKVILRTESFRREQSLRDILISIKRNAVIRDRFDIKTSTNGSRYLTMRSGSGYCLATSGTVVDDKTAERMIQEIMKIGSDAPVIYFPKRKRPID